MQVIILVLIRIIRMMELMITEILFIPLQILMLLEQHIITESRGVDMMLILMHQHSFQQINIMKILELL